MSEFDGMTDRGSVAHQLKRWVEGKPLHNTIRNECCPDFSCCNGGNIMPVEVRQKFQMAVEEGDKEAEMNILGMGLSGLFNSSDVTVHIAGEDTNEH